MLSSFFPSRRSSRFARRRSPFGRLCVEALESRSLLWGSSIVPSDGTTIVNESVSTDTLTIALADAPTGDVVLNIVSSDTGEATVAPATLTFTLLNFSTPQTVTVTGVDDAVL